MTIHKFHAIAYALITFFVLIIDRITKLYALKHLQVPYEVSSFLSGELVFNQGISWGMLNSADGSNFLLVSIIVFVVTLVLIYYAYNRLKEGYTLWGEILVITGSISNMIDRFLYNGVVDFISVHYKAYNFPYFNVADVCIVLGVCIMFMQMVTES